MMSRKGHEVWLPIAALMLPIHQAAEALQDGPVESSCSLTAPAKSLAVGDFDSDGVPDACLGQSYGRVAVHLGLGNGHFAPAAAVDIGTAFLSIVDTDPADLDADGDLDLLVVAYDFLAGQASDLHVLLGSGDGTLGVAAVVPLASGTLDLATADLQADGLPDAVATDQPSESLMVLVNQGGTLQAGATYPCHSLPALGDLSGDGLPDLVVGHGGPYVDVLLGDGAGAFVPAFSAFVLTAPALVMLTDADGDGQPDILASNNQLTVVLRHGPHLTFEAPAPQVLHVIAAAGDLDEDGDAELVSNVYSGLEVASSTDGLDYAVIARLGLPGTATDVAISDLNLDGDADLLVAPSTSGVAQEGVLLALPGFGDGTFVGDVEPLEGFGGCGALGDLDADGHVDGIGVGGVAGTGFFSAVSVYHGLGQARFQPGSWVPTVDTPAESLLVDVDGDDDLDVLVDSWWDVGLHRGDGKGALGAKELVLTCGHPWQLRVTDFDADGDADAGCVCPADFKVKSMLNDGAGTFTAKTAFSYGSSNSGLCFADFTGDNLPDAAVPSDSFGPLSLEVRRGLGDGKFDAPDTFQDLGPLKDVEAGDLDADGDLDLVTIAESRQSLLVLLNDGSGQLAVSAPDWPLGSIDVRDLVLGDFSLDGLLDAVAADTGGASAAVGRLLFLPGEPGGAFGPPQASVPGSTLISAADADADGAPDIKLWGTFFAFNQLGPWEDLDHALAGTHGKPRQVGHGTAQPGTIVSVALHDGARLAPAVQFIGFAEGSVPFKGGVLVPTPDLVNSPLLTDAQGKLLLGGVWPTSFVAGDAFVLQTWIRDDAAPALWSASNALRVTTP